MLYVVVADLIVVILILLALALEGRMVHDCEGMNVVDHVRNAVKAAKDRHTHLPRAIRCQPLDLRNVAWWSAYPIHLLQEKFGI